MIEFVENAFARIHRELITFSFDYCGVTLPLDGSGMSRINPNVLKNEEIGNVVKEVIEK